MSQTRVLRLQSDYRRLRNIDDRSMHIKIASTSGRPPIKYLLTFSVRGYTNRAGAIRNHHQVELRLPSCYPRSEPPHFHIVDGLWHPNVYASGEVCLGLGPGNWHPGFELDQLIYDVGNIICFTQTSFNLGSIARPELDARGWSDWIKRHQVPTERIDFNVGEAPVVRIRTRETSDFQLRIKESPINNESRVVLRTKSKN